MGHTDPLAGFSTRTTTQDRPASPEQVPNSAGGYVFTVDDVTRLRRFLTLGSESNYYVGGGDLTRDNADVVIRMAESNPSMLVTTIIDVSQRGAAPRPNPALFALAIACSHGSPDARAAAAAALPLVARTGTHLFLFAGYVQQFRGWGRGLRRAVGGWYSTKDPDDLAYQVAKYRQREGWSQRDLLRKAHPGAPTAGHRAVYEWVTRGAVGDATPRLLEGFVKAHEDGANIPALIGEYDLSWEMLPDTALTDRAVWDALLTAGMGQTALMRNLPRLTRLGLLPPMGGRTAEVAARLTDTERLTKGRVHPVNVLVAQRTYASGQSARGSSTWNPTPKITDALDAAFYNAFGAVKPAGKRTLLALDVSGSMSMTPIANMPVTPREVSAALALVQMSTEPESLAVGFTSGALNRGPYMYMNRSGLNDLTDALIPLGISPRQRLDDAIAAVSNLPFGGTDCAAPMLWAAQQNAAVDTFVIYTDNQTWAGNVHPHQALTQYREQTGIPARVVVVGMTSTGFSIADPSDPGMLDITGFDSAVPNLISEFSAGAV